MNGPQHYRAAERNIVRASEEAPVREMFFLARAQVHATLALAAAQVEDMESSELRPGWAEIVDGDA